MSYGPLEDLKAIDPPFLWNTSYLKNISRKPDFDVNVKIDWDNYDFTKCRAHNWHCWGGLPRSPYAVIFTSLGCPFKCGFCSVKNYFGEYKTRDVSLVIDDIRALSKKGVKNIRVLDEMFTLDKDRVKEICNGIIGLNLNLWAYSRMDTMEEGILSLMRESGFRWLCLGYESGNRKIRMKYGKGNFYAEDIQRISRIIKNAGINIIGNFIFGFPEDDIRSMRQTLDLALSIKCEYANFYCMMSYPKTDVEAIALKEGWEIPKTLDEFSQYAYECFPLRTYNLQNKTVLKYRDDAFRFYYTSQDYLDMMERKFGKVVLKEIEAMTNIKLKRRLFENDKQRGIQC